MWGLIPKPTNPGSGRDWAVLKRTREMQAVTARLQIHVSTPGLGLQGKLAEDLGVNLGVDIAVAFFCSGMTNTNFPIASAQRKARV